MVVCAFEHPLDPTRAALARLEVKLSGAGVGNVNAGVRGGQDHLSAFVRCQLQRCRECIGQSFGFRSVPGIGVLHFRRHLDLTFAEEGHAGVKRHFDADLDCKRVGPACCFRQREASADSGRLLGVRIILRIQRQARYGLMAQDLHRVDRR